MRAEGITMAGEITTELAYPLDTILNEIIGAAYTSGTAHDGTTTLPTAPTEKFVFGRGVGRR